jgi:hypothetical protein
MFRENSEIVQVDVGVKLGGDEEELECGEGSELRVLP